MSGLGRSKKDDAAVERYFRVSHVCGHSSQADIGPLVPETPAQSLCEKCCGAVQQANKMFEDVGLPFRLTTRAVIHDLLAGANRL